MSDCPACATQHPDDDSTGARLLRPAQTIPQKRAFLPGDAAARKGIPITTGVFDYFPRALAYIAMISKAGNDQHNPGQPLHWAREKSTDHADCIGRHLIERGTRDLQDGLRHSGKLGWRSLANLELELEAAERAGEKW
jgi:hypothetical protein